MDIKRKLSSRKFWLALIGFITPMMTALHYSQETITQVTAIIMGGASLIAYILSEGYIDGKGQEGNVLALPVFDEDEEEDDADDFIEEGEA